MKQSLTPHEQKTLDEIKSKCGNDWFQPAYLIDVYRSEHTCYRLKDKGYLEARPTDWYTPDFRIIDD